jgi:hypothetical protein
MSKQKQITLVVLLVTVILSGVLVQYSTQIKTDNPYLKEIIASIKNKGFIEASGQYGGGTTFVTVDVPVYTSNHLPVITGTCNIGDTLDFMVKYGDTYQNTSQTILGYSCTVSPYSVNTTIPIPDGKYRVDVTAGVGTITTPLF